jgi:CheY-like chemotaxis protein
MTSKKIKILFIEDEPDQIMMISLRLEKNGYEVVSAKDGEEGLGKVKAEKPDLILLDVIMPGISGLEVCRRLKKDPVTQSIPVITSTAAGMDDIEAQCLAVGADDCVRKPYASAELLEKIQRFLKK